MKIILPIYYLQEFKTKKPKNWLVGLNNYRNWHYILSNKIKAHYHQLIKDQVKDTKFDKIKPYYKIYIKSKRIDPHNVKSIIEKFALDGLVECGAIKDDGIDYVVGCLGSEYFVDADNPRVEIFI